VVEINVARSSGFCSGVRAAIDIGKGLAGKRGNVYVLGDIVHNSFVVKDLERRGIKKIKSLKPRRGATLIIRAHGAAKSVFKNAREKGYRIVDATCPKVKDIYRIARRLEKTRDIIIIGERHHDEVKGIAGQLSRKPFIVGSPGEVAGKTALKLARIKKAAVVTQSTQSASNISKVMEKLYEVVPDIKLYDTTCRITKVKQEEIRSIALGNDMVFVVGSRTSANTGRLYEIAKSLNKRTLWIESAADLRLPGKSLPERIGIMAGASTPDEITGEIVRRIRGIYERSGK